MQMLKRLGAKVYFPGPPQWYDNEFEVYGHWLPLDELVDQVDVMMMLRVQHERHDGSESFSKRGLLTGLWIDSGTCSKMQDHAIIMHPAPVNRDVELADPLVEGLRSRIVTQNDEWRVCPDGNFRSGIEWQSLIIRNATNRDRGGSNMKTLIKNGKIIADGDHCIPAEIWIEDGIIQAIGTTFQKQGSIK